MPPTDPSCSFPVHPAAMDPADLKRDCRVENTRRGGPGGQRRNKVETAVVVEHLPTGVIAQASERRSREENLRLALWRLRRKLAIGVRLAPGAGGPGEAWRRHLNRGRLSVNDQHDDVPAMLAEALDELEACGFDPARAAAKLLCSPTQLVRFLARDAEVFEQINRRREAAGLHRLNR